MKKLLISSMVLGLVLTSCGSNESQESSTASLKPQSTKVTGVLGSHYEVVDKEYKIESDEMYPILSVSIKRISDDLPFEPSKTDPYGSSSIGKNTHIGFGIELFDVDGNSIETINATADGLSGVYSSDDIESIINMQNGETATVRWSVEANVLQKAKSFRITSALEVDNNVATGSINSVGSSDVSDFDELLDSYESYISSYIKLMKKMKTNPNDMSVMTEYADLMQKTQDLTTELGKEQGDMTQQQMKRFVGLQAKFTKGMATAM